MIMRAGRFIPFPSPKSWRDLPPAPTPGKSDPLRLPGPRDIGGSARLPGPWEGQPGLRLPAPPVIQPGPFQLPHLPLPENWAPTFPGPEKLPCYDPTRPSLWL